MNTLATAVNRCGCTFPGMFLCQCDVCLTTRARVILELAQLGDWQWWLHTQEINDEARRACEAARAEGYVDPPSRFPRGIPAA